MGLLSQAFMDVEEPKTPKLDREGAYLSEVRTCKLNQGRHGDYFIVELLVKKDTNGGGGYMACVTFSLDNKYSKGELKSLFANCLPIGLSEAEVFEESDAALEGRENRILGSEVCVRIVPSVSQGGRAYNKTQSDRADAFSELLSLAPSTTAAPAPVPVPVPPPPAPVAVKAPVDPEAALKAAGWARNPQATDWCYRPEDTTAPQRLASDILSEIG